MGKDDKEDVHVADEAVNDHIDIGKSKDEDGNTRWNFSISPKILIPSIVGVILSALGWVYTNVKEVPKLKEEIRLLREAYDEDKLNSYEDTVKLITLLKMSSNNSIPESALMPKPPVAISLAPTPEKAESPPTGGTGWTNWFTPKPEAAESYPLFEETTIDQSDELILAPVSELTTDKFEGIEQVQKEASELKQEYEKKIETQKRMIEKRSKK